MVNPLKLALLGATHPSELRALVTYKVWHDARELAKDPETGYQRAEMKRCWEFLDMTSRSFAAVIKELEGELCRVVCLFYLVLRGLDTVEDDMSIELEEKCQVLESFHEKLSTPGWTYNGCGCSRSGSSLPVEPPADACSNAHARDLAISHHHHPNRRLAGKRQTAARRV